MIPVREQIPTVLPASKITSSGKIDVTPRFVLKLLSLLPDQSFVNSVFLDALDVMMMRAVRPVIPIQLLTGTFSFKELFAPAKLDFTTIL